MEPESTTPPSEPQFSPQAPQAGDRNKKKLIIGLIIAIVIVIVIALIFSRLTGKKSDSSNKVDTSDTSVYYDRAGYDRKTLKDNIGDPMALKITAGDEAQELTSGSVVIPACSVLTLDNIQKEGLKLYPNSFGTPFTQNYLDEAGKAPFAPSGLRYPSSDESMSCGYGIGAGDADAKTLQSVRVSVNQPFTVTAAVANDRPSMLNYAKQPDMGGYEVYSRTSTSVGKETTYLLRKNGNSIEISFELKDEQKMNNLVTAAVANLQSLESKPKGPSTVSYDSPTFKQTFARSCDLVDNADVKSLTGSDMSPLAQSFWSTATGVADFSKVSDNKTKTNYVRNRCIRVGNNPEYKTLVGTSKHTVQVTSTTYENADAAKLGLLNLSVGGDSNDSKVRGSGIGEEAYIYKTPDDDHQNAIAFRQGRVVIEIVYDFAFQKNDPSVADLNSYGQKLSPLAENIAAKLKSSHF